MLNFKLSFVIEKKLFAFLDAPKESLIDSVYTLIGQHANQYVIKNIELRNDSCPEEKYHNIIKRLKPEIEKMRHEGLSFSLHSARSIEDSNNLDDDIMSVLKRDANLAKESGIPLMITHASFSIRSPKKKRYYSIMHLLTKLNTLGLETGVKIAIENISLKNGVLQNTNDHFFILDFINKNDLDNVGIALDFGHALSCGFSTEYVVQVIEKSKKKLFHIHAHETDFGEDIHAALVGKLEWRKIFESLENIHYSNSFVLEMRSPSITESLEYLQSINATFKN